MYIIFTSMSKRESFQSLESIKSYSSIENLSKECFLTKKPTGINKENIKIENLKHHFLNKLEETQLRIKSEILNNMEKKKKLEELQESIDYLKFFHNH